MAGEPELTHLDDSGRVRMVDVGPKEVTDREAIAEGGPEPPPPPAPKR